MELGEPILVTGASGKTGQRVVTAIARKGGKVRAFVRRPDAATAVQAAGASEIALGDLLDRESLQRAAQHLPRVDAIGGSAAGVYVRNEVRVASLFRGVPAERFEREIRPMFFALQQQWGGVPFEVPVKSIVIFVIAAIVVGLIAAIFPARRASRLDVLAALQYE